MQLIRVILNICGFIAGLFVLGYIFRLIILLVSVIKNLIIKEPINIKKSLSELNVFNKVYSIFSNQYKEEPNADIKQNNRTTQIICVMVVVGLIYIAILESPMASKEIGSILEKDEYTAYYYVNMFPENSQSKNYQVKAKIYAHTERYDEYKSERYYEIQEAYFPNNGTITFYDSGDLETLEINQKVRVRDDNNRWWEIELTSQKANKPSN